MSDYERGIRDAIRWRMTHCESFTAEPGEPRTDNDHFHITFAPDRVKPGQMLSGSAENRERMIELAQDAACRTLT